MFASGGGGSGGGQGNFPYPTFLSSWRPMATWRSSTPALRICCRRPTSVSTPRIISARRSFAVSPCMPYSGTTGGRPAFCFVLLCKRLFVLDDDVEEDFLDIAKLLMVWKHSNIGLEVDNKAHAERSVLQFPPQVLAGEHEHTIKVFQTPFNGGRELAKYWQPLKSYFQHKLGVVTAYRHAEPLTAVTIVAQADNMRTSTAPTRSRARTSCKGKPSARQFQRRPNQSTIVSSVWPHVMS